MDPEMVPCPIDEAVTDVSPGMSTGNLNFLGSPTVSYVVVTLSLGRLDY